MTINSERGTVVDHRSLAASLAPVLNAMCDGRLGEITWFKADWQRGGAATGFSTYRRDDGTEAAVVLKLPVVQRELTWLTRLQDADDPDPVVPRLFASGDSLGGYDLTWVVMERFLHGPLGLKWHEDHIRRIAEAAARFHALAARHETDQPARDEPWDDLLAEAGESVKVNRLPQQQVWVSAIKSLRGRLDSILDEWRARDAAQWLHGDLHLANAMSRHAMDHGSVSLIDLAEVHAGHWIEDAIYFERQLWARQDRLEHCSPVKAIAKARKKLGVPVEADYPRLAMLRRALLAATAPRFLKTEGHPRHLDACLHWLQAAMSELK
ncbi:MAG: phosphotransferase [Planctomycetota bacterium]|nr:phosphotransferase [Planctomycetota bacterium]